MRSGAIIKHLEALSHILIRGFLLRLGLIGSASGLGWLANLLMLLGAENFSTIVKVGMTAFVLVLISITWMLMTLWFTIELRLLKSLTIVLYEYLRNLTNKR